ncbi:MAG TPA: hypothetical protein VE546_03870 [Streptomyces sp.]|uniref:hypothetical protein n=1 Tax=Streptomyces sp. TaxID=1931 RepID=UPI002D7324C5|nr:hypothetical protein [Streptomyces sp.]HZG02712.1 hypothetical protein [Streptomyces sp.]
MADTNKDKTPQEPSESGKAREFREAERRRERARPFDYPYEERRANVRARRHISREEADADMPPGLSGSYGTTGGGQPAGPARARPGRSVVGEDPAGVVDEEGTAGEGGEDTGR